MLSPQLRNNVAGRPIVHFASPGIRNHPQSSSIVRNPTSEYITHLIPNHHPVTSQIEGEPSTAFQPQHSSCIKHYFIYNSDNKSNSSNSRLHKNNLMNNTDNITTLATRSRGASGVSNKKSIIIQQQYKN